MASEKTGLQQSADDLSGSRKDVPAVRCYLCKKPCDGSLRDGLGERFLGRELPVCDACNDYLEREPFDHKEWS